MHGLDTSNVLSRVVSRRDEPSGIWAIAHAVNFISVTREQFPNHVVELALLTGFFGVRFDAKFADFLDGFEQL